MQLLHILLWVQTWWADKNRLSGIARVIGPPEAGRTGNKKMGFTPLALVRQRVMQGGALPFNVYNNDQTLLLAKGQIITSHDVLMSLFERGSLVSLQELTSESDAIAKAPASELPRLWASSMERMHEVLSKAEPETLREALDEAAAPVQALIDRDPDLAILQVLRQEGNAHTQYGLNHAVHTAIICRLVAQRLRWSESDSNRAFKAALTMNLSMFELQGILAAQPDRPTSVQRELILNHPARSRTLLEQAGVADSTWLLAVEQHHVAADGSGYPPGVTVPCELASLLNKADIYSAKLSPRRTRDPLPADRATCEIFMRDPGNPVSAALVKEFGVYPPGCYVALASGETGVVIKRGPTVMTPLVIVLFDAQGRGVDEAIRRDTVQKDYAITSAVSSRALKLAPAVAYLGELATS
jgi:HD-GYP domain-containing protein (c-di-GMP phosphodiesterase class II)